MRTEITSFLRSFRLICLAIAMMNPGSQAFTMQSYRGGASTHLRRVHFPPVTQSGTFEADLRLHSGFFEEVGAFFKRFTTKAKASHILIKGGAEAENKLEDLKIEIENSPVKFAEAAARYSECPSASSGGSLGEFGPGAMVKEFDQVVFNEAIGMVHGPVRTQFGYHLIYISDRIE